MAQGHIDSNVHLANILERVIPQKDKILWYQDDVCISHGKNIKEAMDDLLLVLSRIHDSGLKLHPMKAKIFQNNVIFLGYLIKKNSINIPLEKCRSFVDTPYPCTRISLIRFINSLSFFRSSIPLPNTPFYCQNSSEKVIVT